VPRGDIEDSTDNDDSSQCGGEAQFSPPTAITIQNEARFGSRGVTVLPFSGKALGFTAGARACDCARRELSDSSRTVRPHRAIATRVDDEGFDFAAHTLNGRLGLIAM
jgi:hypothetical protein